MTCEKHENWHAQCPKCAREARRLLEEERDEAVRAEREAWRQTDRVRKERDSAIYFADIHRRLREDTLEANKKLCAKLDEARMLLRDVKADVSGALWWRIENYLKENK